VLLTNYKIRIDKIRREFAKAIALLIFIEAIGQSRVRHDSTYAALVFFALVCLAANQRKLLLKPTQTWFFYWLPVAMVAALTLGTGFDPTTPVSTIDTCDRLNLCRGTEVRDRLRNSS